MIRTERLLLVPLTYEQLVSRVYARTGMVTNDEEEKNFVEYSLKPMKLAEEKNRNWFTIWDAMDSDGNRVLECGYICPPIQKIVEVWYYATKEFMNKGFATEAVKGLIKFATAFDINHVCASIRPDNIASKRVAEKCGLTYLSDNKEMKIYNLKLK